MSDPERPTSTEAPAGINRRRLLQTLGATAAGFVAVSGTASAHRSKFFGCDRVCTGTDGSYAVVAVDGTYQCREMQQADIADVPWDWESYCYEASTGEVVIGLLEENVIEGNTVNENGTCTLCLNPNDCASASFDSAAAVVDALNASDTCDVCAGHVTVGTDCSISAVSTDSGDSTDDGSSSDGSTDDGSSSEDDTDGSSDTDGNSGSDGGNDSDGSNDGSESGSDGSSDGSSSGDTGGSGDGDESGSSDGSGTGEETSNDGSNAGSNDGTGGGENGNDQGSSDGGDTDEDEPIPGIDITDEDGNELADDSGDSTELGSEGEETDPIQTGTNATDATNATNGSNATGATNATSGTDATRSGGQSSSGSGGDSNDRSGSNDERCQRDPEDMTAMERWYARSDTPPNPSPRDCGDDGEESRTLTAMERWYLRSDTPDGPVDVLRRLFGDR